MAYKCALGSDSAGSVYDGEAADESLMRQLPVIMTGEE